MNNATDESLNWIEIGPQQHRRYRELTRVVRALTSAGTYEDMMRQITGGALAVLDADASLLLVREKKTLLALRREREQVGDIQSLDMSFDERVHRYLNRHLPGKVAAVPLVCAKGIFGLLAVGLKPDVAIDEQSEWLLSALADQAALALSLARDQQDRVDDLNFQLDEFRSDDEGRQMAYSSLAHDFRTPLMTITMCCEVLQKKVAEKDLLEFIKHIQIASNHLDAMSTNLLEMGRLASGLTVVNCQLNNVKPIVEEAVVITAPRGRPTDVRVAVDLIETQAWFDPTALRQVLVNLLGNAIKFSPDNAEVRVEITREREHTSIRIIDQGPGIPPDEQQAIFKPYTRAKNISSGDKPGVGLGLAIVRRLVDLMQAQVAVESAPGKGATFIVTLPPRDPHLTD